MRKPLRPAPTVQTRLFDGELVILDMARGEYLALDPIGSKLWAGIVAGRGIEEIALDIVAEYEVTLDQATEDLQGLADDLVAQGLMVEA